MVSTSVFYIDCEFDDHNGPLISMAVVRDDGESIYIKTPWAKSRLEILYPPQGQPLPDLSWVDENVLPIVDSHNCERVYEVSYNSVGQVLRDFIDQEDSTVIADSPVDIGYLCRAWSTGSDGNWKSSHMELITFKVINIDVYPTSLVGAIQHNAWYDAMALRHALKNTKSMY